MKNYGISLHYCEGEIKTAEINFIWALNGDLLF